jgi:hypothetical protein
MLQTIPLFIDGPTVIALKTVPVLGRAGAAYLACGAAGHDDCRCKVRAT